MCKVVGMTSCTDRSKMSTADGTTSLSSLRLPDGFTDVFTSRLVELNGLRLARGSPAGTARRCCWSAVATDLVRWRR